MQDNSVLRVLHIIASVRKESGGPVEGLTQSVIYRQSIGQYIEVLTLDPNNAEFLNDFPCKVTGVGPTPKKYGYTPKLKQWIVENAGRFDVAVIHGLWNHASVGGWQGCVKANLPYVLFTHGMMDPWFKKAYPLKHWLKQMFWIIQGPALKHASEVLFTSEEEKKLAQGVFWGFKYNAKVVSYAAGEAIIPSHEAKNTINQILKDVAEKPYLLYLSRIHEKKGCDLLLKAFAKLDKRKDLQLVMAGPCHDDYINILKKLALELGISDRVHWPGMLKGELKAAVFNKAEAFVLTSHQENFGIAVAEALAYGKAVLISDQINIWREIEKGGAGIVAPDTVDGALSVLQRWENMTNVEKQQMSDAARRTYLANFTVQAAAEDLTVVLQKAKATRRIQ
ncbi:glycosyltransferase [Acinetobacter johnsonii]|uniref:glycosyltransferase n=1 Tax=Acinetobacter johnsonii TaxID=40214 RepID=UPI0024478B67|nr:glycosyltransferase [Acinetobacter johnsonii]MDH1532369.1 glycosyltransferase [Acinetobacter johnsonii]